MSTRLIEGGRWQIEMALLQTAIATFLINDQASTEA
jgi:hypothetical protein